MNEEKNVETRECNCFCKSEGFRNFLVTALGTFVGVYFALSLFSAIHKPPMHCPCFMHHRHFMEGQLGPHHNFNGLDKKQIKEFKGNFEKRGISETPDNDD